MLILNSDAGKALIHLQSVVVICKCSFQAFQNFRSEINFARDDNILKKERKPDRCYFYSITAVMFKIIMTLKRRKAGNKNM